MHKPCDNLKVQRIDGIDISTIGLEDLRTRIVRPSTIFYACQFRVTRFNFQTIVSQDVSLFSGTIRSNLDPFGEHTDLECWDVLERCHLTVLLNRTPEKRSANLTLDMPITQGGSLSAGERQLMALARAVLRRTNIIIMDEATSQIDSRLDDQVGRELRARICLGINLCICRSRRQSARSYLLL